MSEAANCGDSTRRSCGRCRTCISSRERSRGASCAGGSPFDESADMIVIANCDQDQVAGKRHEQDPQIESGSELEELPEGSQPDARVQMRPAKGRFEPSDGMVHSGLLLGREFLESPVINKKAG